MVDPESNDPGLELIDRGNELSENGRHREAIKYFEKAEKVGTTWAGLNVGNSFAALGKYKKAREAFERAWATGDENSGFNLARLVETRGKTSKARKIYRALIASNYSPAMDQEAFYLYEEGRKKDAINLMKRASEGGGDLGNRAAGIVGVWMWEQKDLAAEEWLRRGQDHYMLARTSLADLLALTERRDEAIQTLIRGAESGEKLSRIELLARSTNEAENGEAR